MVNELKVAKVLSIQALHAQGWSQRRIARKLGIHRETVARHLGQASKPAKAPTGSGHERESELTKDCPPEAEWTGTSSAGTGASPQLPAGDAAPSTRRFRAILGPS